MWLGYLLEIPNSMSFDSLILIRCFISIEKPLPLTFFSFWKTDMLGFCHAWNQISVERFSTHKCQGQSWQESLMYYPRYSQILTCILADQIGAGEIKLRRGRAVLLYRNLSTHTLFFNFNGCLLSTLSSKNGCKCPKLQFSTKMSIFSQIWKFYSKCTVWDTYSRFWKKV